MSNGNNVPGIIPAIAWAMRSRLWSNLLLSGAPRVTSTLVMGATHSYCDAQAECCLLQSIQYWAKLHIDSARIYMKYRNVLH